MEQLMANKALFLYDTTEFARYIAAEEARKKLLLDLCNQLLSGTAEASAFDDNFETLGGQGRSEKAADEDEKENFLMPAPRVRPPRNRKRNTKYAPEDVRISKSSRVTRSSKMSDLVLHEESLLVKKGRKTKSSVKESLISVQNTSVSVFDSSSTSMTRESRKGRRTTKKGKENPGPRASTRVTRASTRASTRSSGKRKSSVLELRNTLGPKRLTRSKIANASNLEPEEQYCISEFPVSHTSKKSNQNVSKVALFSPYDKSSVKKRVEAFEGLSSEPEIKKVKEKKTSKVASPVQMGTLFSNAPLILGTPNRLVLLSSAASCSSIENGKRVDSPLISSKNKIGQQKIGVVVESLKEEVDQDVSSMEFEEDVLTLQIEEILDSPEVIEEGSTEESKNTELYTHGPVFVKKIKGRKMPKGDENEADDEWVTDDEDTKTPKTTGKNSSICSSIPKATASATRESQDAVGSYKALRSRKVKNTSDMFLTLSSKAKTPNIAKLVKPPDTENEAELKRQKEEERQNEALRRKEELLKKRTEVTKKKREEKMSKVKRTREEREKEKEVKKMKKAKLLGGKKKKADMAEAEITKTPVRTTLCPKDEAHLNTTFDVPAKKLNAGDEYNMTPHWQDVSPKQPDNPNDFGIADNSDCSSGEETDPRKKIPLWAQMKPNDNLLLTQCLLPQSTINLFWQSKPRAPTIQEFFGNHVSSKTLRRGVNHRTSSAVWNTPPLRN